MYMVVCVKYRQFPANISNNSSNFFFCIQPHSITSTWNKFIHQSWVFFLLLVVVLLLASKIGYQMFCNSFDRFWCCVMEFRLYREQKFFMPVLVREVNAAATTAVLLVLVELMVASTPAPARVFAIDEMCEHICVDTMCKQTVPE